MNKRAINLLNSLNYMLKTYNILDKKYYYENTTYNDFLQDMLYLQPFIKDIEYFDKYKEIVDSDFKLILRKDYIFLGYIISSNFIHYHYLNFKKFICFVDGKSINPKYMKKYLNYEKSMLRKNKILKIIEKNNN